MKSLYHTKYTFIKFKNNIPFSSSELWKQKSFIYHKQKAQQKVQRVSKYIRLSSPLRAEVSAMYGPSCPLRAELSTGRVVRESGDIFMQA